MVLGRLGSSAFCAQTYKRVVAASHMCFCDGCGSASLLAATVPAYVTRFPAGWTAAHGGRGDHAFWAYDGNAWNSAFARWPVDGNAMRSGV